MSLIEEKFSSLRAENRTAFMPFITAGDPDLEFTEELLLALDKAGCDLVEIGFPYSDPIADGPVIQASYTRALDAGIHVEEILQMIGRVRESVSLPMVGMVSFAIIHRQGMESFVGQSALAGLAGLIVPDLPVDESAGLQAICQQHDLDLVQLITPTTAADRAEMIATNSRGFIYYVSIAGITGERNQLPADLTANLNRLRDKTTTPVCVGFGVSGAEQARMLDPVAEGVIVGSAIVRRIAEALPDRQLAKEQVLEFVDELVSAVHAS